MSTQFYQVVHVFSVIMMTAVTFGAMAAPHPEHRKTALKWSGILALLALIAGFGLLGQGGFGFPVWVFVKLVCWLGLTALTGMAFRMPGQISSLRLLALIAVLLATSMVYMKPF